LHALNFNFILVSKSSVINNTELHSPQRWLPRATESNRTFIHALYVVDLVLRYLLYTRTVQPVATCRHSPYVHKAAIVKLLSLIYGFAFRSAFLY